MFFLGWGRVWLTLGYPNWWRAWIWLHIADAFFLAKPSWCRVLIMVKRFFNFSPDSLTSNQTKSRYDRTNRTTDLLYKPAMSGKLAKLQYQKKTVKTLNNLKTCALSMHHLTLYRPYSYPPYWTGPSLQWKLVRGINIEKRLSFISRLGFMLVSVQ